MFDSYKYHPDYIMDVIVTEFANTSSSNKIIHIQFHRDKMGILNLIVIAGVAAIFLQSTEGNLCFVKKLCFHFKIK